MPIYEYQCKSCHHTFDLMQKMQDDPVTNCPQCSKDTVIRLVSAAGFQLKGTGWYVTDFRDKGKVNRNTDDVKSAVTSVSENKTTEAKSSASVSPKKGETD